MVFNSTVEQWELGITHGVLHGYDGMGRMLCYGLYSSRVLIHPGRTHSAAYSSRVSRRRQRVKNFPRRDDDEKKDKCPFRASLLARRGECSLFLDHYG